MHALLITCERRDLEHLLDALGDWQTDGEAKIVLYGTTNKLQDGFILMQWNQPISEGFQRMQLKADPSIFDYVVYDLSALPQPPVPTTL
jgi:hypothetical protein